MTSRSDTPPLDLALALEAGARVCEGRAKTLTGQAKWEAMKCARSIVGLAGHDELRKLLARERGPDMGTWWCYDCARVVDAGEITNDERHACGSTVLFEMPRAEPDDDEGVRCTCEWQSPDHGGVHARWPAETEWRCLVHGRSEAESEAWPEGPPPEQ